MRLNITKWEEQPGAGYLTRATNAAGLLGATAEMIRQRYAPHIPFGSEVPVMEIDWKSGDITFHPEFPTERLDLAAMQELYKKDCFGHEFFQDPDGKGLELEEMTAMIEM